MDFIAITPDSLLSALEHLTPRQQVKTLRCLKEAAISTQSYHAASWLRQREKLLRGQKLIKP